MTTLLELKEKLVRFYGKYEVYITPIVKFIVAFAALMTIDRNIGYMELVSSTPVALISGCSVPSCLWAARSLLRRSSYWRICMHYRLRYVWSHFFCLC